MKWGAQASTLSRERVTSTTLVFITALFEAQLSGTFEIKLLGEPETMNIFKSWAYIIKVHELLDARLRSKARANPGICFVFK